MDGWKDGWMDGRYQDLSREIVGIYTQIQELS
jgi:hypothetical protein